MIAPKKNSMEKPSQVFDRLLDTKRRKITFWDHQREVIIALKPLFGICKGSLQE